MSSSLLDVALAINATLFNSIWEGILIVMTVWLVMRCLPSIGAASRYAIWMCTLVALIAIPVVTALKPAATPILVAARSAAPARPAQLRNEKLERLIVQGTPLRPSAIQASETTSVQTVPKAQASSRITVPQTLVVAIALLWAIVTCGRLLRLGFDFVDLAAIRRESTAWGNAYGFPVYTSKRICVPIAVGLLRPCVVLPRSLVKDVDESTLQAILIHETAHLQRYDVWTNTFAQVLEAMVTFNPVAWFVAKQILTQREIACDDWVVARTNSSERFARALASMASGAQGRTLAAAPGAFGSRHALVERIAQLMDSERPRQLRFSASALTSALAFLTVLGFTFQAVSPALALAPQGIPLVQLTTAQPTPDCKHISDYEPILRRTSGPGSTGMDQGSSSDRTLQEFTALHLPGILTYQVNVDATGHPHDFKILKSSTDPGLDRAVESSVMGASFTPAHHDCVAAAATYKSGLVSLAKPILRSSALRYRILPEPGGAPRTCAIAQREPSIVHKIEPQIPSWLAKLAVTRSFESVVKVHVDASGRLSDAARYAVETSPDNAQKAFDDITVATAKRYVYAPGIRNCMHYSSAYLIRTTLTKWLTPGIGRKSGWYNFSLSP
ncbi:MAG: hypothetical protein NVSMB31_01950 [Vulcanimicrobiaceae bacterium]